MARILRPLSAAAILACGLVLAACQSPGGTAAHDPEPESTPTSTPRMGWRVTADTSFGLWQPEDVCGGDAVFTGVFFRIEEPLVDTQGNQVPAPLLELSPAYGADDTFEYFWDANMNSVDSRWVPGALWQGGGILDGFGPDADGHPPARVEQSGDEYTAVDAYGGTETFDDGWVVFTFERIPEPAHCLEDEQFWADPENSDSDLAWHYYD